MCDDPVSLEPYPVLVIYQEICSAGGYLLTLSSYLVELPMNIILLCPFFLLSLNMR